MTGSIQPAAFRNARETARETLDQVRGELLDARESQGHWTGFLSPSALGTATAVSAMSAVLLNSSNRADELELRTCINKAIAYLRGQQNSDGGFGDTDRSHSNIATSYLVLSASSLVNQIGESGLDDSAMKRLDQYLDHAGRLEGLKKRYGKDKTFVVPIMNNMAIAGLISWDDVARLPFEAAVFPQSMYRYLQMPVVSYAIPALVAIGQARHFLGRKAFFPVRMMRSLAVNRTLNVLQRMQPESGGYLEASPLTAFVVMSLAATQRCELSVVKDGLRFLKESMLEDGSWPIDTNLATWVTSLSVHALASDPDDDGSWCTNELARWHLSCQHKQRHPFTGAEPGGWGWTDLSGAVPDSDDTPAAILATGQMRPYVGDSVRSEIDQAQLAATGWLLRLQNRNGGWPTFCRGWGKLPFDRSSTDLTAHALRALDCVAGDQNSDRPSFPEDQIRPAKRGGLRFLMRNQSAKGGWDPLWFGNQDRPDESNPIYGTAKVLLCADLSEPMRTHGVEFLLQCQNPDGGWGGGLSVATKLKKFATQNPASDVEIPEGLISTVEETALAVDALSTCLLMRRRRLWTTKKSSESQADGKKTARNAKNFEKCLQKLYNDSTVSVPTDSDEPADSSRKGATTAAGNDPVLAAILSGVEFLAQSVTDKRHQVAWPIGFYFAKLWYHERLYPTIFTAAALGKFLRATGAVYDDRWPR